MHPKQSEPIESKPKETISSRNERREAEIALAMKEEAARRAAVPPASPASGPNLQSFSVHAKAKSSRG